MDDSLRLAWTQIVTPEDYDKHMAEIGQAQAAAVLTRSIIETSVTRDCSRVLIVGAGTGQMLDFLDPALLCPFRITCTDLNRSFLARLEQRLLSAGIRATLLEDDIEHTALDAGWDLLLATLLLEHVDWHRAVEVIASLRPKACGIIVQENPEGMSSAVTPGRPIPLSIAKAIEIAHPTLVPRNEPIAAFDDRGYHCRATFVQEVADRKHLVAMLFTRTVTVPSV